MSDETYYEDEPRMSTAIFEDGPYRGAQMPVDGLPWLIRRANPQRYEDDKAPSALAYRLTRIVVYYSLDGAAE